MATEKHQRARDYLARLQREVYQRLGVKPLRISPGDWDKLEARIRSEHINCFAGFQDFQGREPLGDVLAQLRRDYF